MKLFLKLFAVACFLLVLIPSFSFFAELMNGTNGSLMAAALAAATMFSIAGWLAIKAHNLWTREEPTCGESGQDSSSQPPR